MLCCDGKRVTAGLNNEFGDVDMFGFDAKPTANESRHRVDDEKCQVDELIELANDNDQHFHNKDTLLNKLRANLFLLTSRIR